MSEAFDRVTSMMRQTVEVVDAVNPRFVNELSDGCAVAGAFLLRSKEMRAARNGDAYLVLTLADRTGSIPGVLFKPDPSAVAIPSGSVVQVVGRVTSFRGSRRISVDRLRPASSWDPDDLMASTTRSRAEVAAEFTAIVRSVSDPGLRATLRRIFGDAAFFERFSTCPGAQSHHHAYLGGLIEHTVGVAALCASLADRYEGVARDLLVTAALLHDVGKVEELRFDTGIGFTDRGRLIGHVVLGSEIVTRAARDAGLDSEVEARLQHALLSHHGELEWGAPRRPATLEALLLHHADNLDAKAAGMSDILAGATRAEEAWTDASNLFRRPLYAPRSAEDDRTRV
ncbi:MAG: HD domain-containing protein, partial [Actinobacteria bacterium]